METIRIYSTERRTCGDNETEFTALQPETTDRQSDRQENKQETDNRQTTDRQHQQFSMSCCWFQGP